MHNACHATLEIESSQKNIPVYELMSSPINQLQKANFSSYRSGEKRPLGDGITYTSTILREEFYDAHSNAMLIRVNDRTINYEIFRTKKSRRGEVFGHPDLFVADGSIVPTAIGPNPSMTIGALAERISEQIIKKSSL